MKHLTFGHTEPKAVRNLAFKFKNFRSVSPTVYHSQPSSTRGSHSNLFHIEQSTVRPGHNMVSNNIHGPPRSIKSCGSPPTRESSRGMFLPQSVKVEEGDREDSYEVLRLNKLFSTLRMINVYSDKSNRSK